METEASHSTTPSTVGNWPWTQFAMVGTGVVLVNLAVAAIIRPLADVPSTFVPLRSAAVGIVSVFAVVAICATRWAATRWTSRPRLTFTAVVTIGFVISMLPVIGTEMADTNPDLRSPNATATVAVTLLHLIPTLFALGPVRRDAPRHRPADRS